MLDIAIPERGYDEPLTRTAIASLRVTLKPETYRIHVRSGVHAELGSEDVGRKLDSVVATLPDDAEWLFTMHNDAAVLSPGWYEWLQHSRELCGAKAAAFLSTNRGWPHPAGALYSVAWLRETKASFMPNPDIVGHDGFGLDCGESIPFRVEPATGFQGKSWMWRVYTARDSTGRPLYAHLGGGTIGAGALRPPVWWWCRQVRRHLESLTPDPTAYWRHAWWEA